MATFIVHDLPDEVHHALRLRAARHGHSTEAEIRDILTTAVLPEHLGDALALTSAGMGLSNADVEALEQTLEKAPAEPMRFE